MTHGKTTWVGLGGALLALAGTLLPLTPARAGADGRKNTTIALGAAAIAALLTHNTAAGVALGAGAVYAETQYEAARRAERDQQNQRYYDYRSGGYRQYPNPPYNPNGYGNNQYRNGGYDQNNRNWDNSRNGQNNRDWNNDNHDQDYEQNSSGACDQPNRDNSRSQSRFRDRRDAPRPRNDRDGDHDYDSSR